MKRHQWIICGLAVLVAGIGGQMTAFGLDAVYNTTVAVTLHVAGAPAAKDTTGGTLTANSDGSFGLVVGADDFTGNYTLSKNGKQVALTLDGNGQSVLESAIMDGITSIAANGGVTLSNLTLSKVKVTISKATIKNGSPQKFTVSVSGRASAGANGKSVTRSFTYKAAVVVQ
jgi:hypothetical protein